MDAETSSADPQALLAYAEVGLRVDADLEARAMRLGAVLDQFAATCTEYKLGIDGRVADRLRALAQRDREHNLWVRSVAQQFIAADQSTVDGPSLGVSWSLASAGEAGVSGAVALLQLVLEELPPEVAAQVVALLEAGDVLDALRVAGLAQPDDQTAATGLVMGGMLPGDAPGEPSNAWDAARADFAGWLQQAREALADRLDALGNELPPAPDVPLDPDGQIARAARGEPVNPLEWARELAGYESKSVLAYAPDEVRQAQVSISLPGVGQQTLSAQALVALAMDPTNLIGAGPVEGESAAILTRALAYASGPARAAIQRLLDGIAPEVADALVRDAAVAAERAGVSERAMQRSMLMAAESSRAAEAVGGYIDYGTVDELGRPSGIEAVITQGMLGNQLGSEARRSIIPPGYVPQIPPLARGHLLGRQLGGSGDVYTNLVTLFQNETNVPVMLGIEDDVRAAAESGQVVRYEVTPMYEGDALRPARLHIRAQGSLPVGVDGTPLSIDVTIENRPTSAPLDFMP